MSETVTVKEVSTQDWPALSAKFSDLTYEQDMAYVTAGAQRVGAKVRAFSVWQNDDLIGAACLRIKAVPGLGRGIAYLSGGPMIGHGPAEEATQRAQAVLSALHKKLVTQEGHLLRLRPSVTLPEVSEQVITDGGFGPTDRTHFYRTVLIDLEPDTETLRKNLHSKWRYELRRSEREDIQIQTGRSAALLDRFMMLYGAMREFKSFKQEFDPAFLDGMLETSFDFDVRIATHEGTDIGGHITAFTPGCATYLFGATTKAGRDLRAGYALGWDAIEGSRVRGARWFDLGGVDKETNAAGYTFKIRTGGEEKQALGPYEAGTRLGGTLLRGIESLYGALKR